MRSIALIHSGSFFHLADLRDPAVKAYDVREIYAPEMDEHSLDNCDALFIAARQHPQIMQQIAPHVLNFMGRAGVKTFVDGENQVGTWLPGVKETRRGTNFWAWRTGEDLGRRSINPAHPMWNYLSDEAVHWHYHAVLNPPEGATALVHLEVLDNHRDEDHLDPWGEHYLAIAGEQNVLLYHDEVSFPSEIVVSTMDATYHHGAGFMPGATQLFYRMLRWLSA
ncbi:hypothetical protein [Corynebacterium belfantii]|uniref:Trehalose utilization n=1 Tax=Corynebacterium belfantii TaxID=2014537 RepID=A0ABS0LDI6_9CORY|nr:hypothetical protein [Corynebacterium belfantii]OLN14738.1 hypothetical protein BUE64_11340 [Corynebacterium diphtheriae subsp. lausannense]QVI99442.1 hypothetical protein KFR76_05030 [Corynebacterium diphtheriae]MBG9258947.1 hypothetical protein [Corynebacterium belfantii]MBG9265635.1 hypothetical protein [Corynebacterium belfantii]MBG9288695.1 hypothetical protein [Corynebacterium belfantii]